MCQVHAFFISDYVGGAEKQDRTSDLVNRIKTLFQFVNFLQNHCIYFPFDCQQNK